MTMLAFHNDQTIKDKCVERVKARRLAGELILKFGFDKHDYLRESIETGFPTQLLCLNDTIFLHLPGIAQHWSEKFLLAPRVGADLTTVYHKFFIWVLSGSDEQSIKEVIRLHQALIDGESVSIEQWKTAAYAAFSDYNSTTASAYAVAAASSCHGYVAAAASLRGKYDDYFYSTYTACHFSGRPYPEMANKLIELLQAA